MAAAISSLRTRSVRGCDRVVPRRHHVPWLAHGRGAVVYHLQHARKIRRTGSIVSGRARATCVPSITACYLRRRLVRAWSVRHVRLVECSRFHPDLRRILTRLRISRAPERKDFDHVYTRVGQRGPPRRARRVKKNGQPRCRNTGSSGDVEGRGPITSCPARIDRGRPSDGHRSRILRRGWLHPNAGRTHGALMIIPLWRSCRISPFDHVALANPAST